MLGVSGSVTSFYTWGKRQRGWQGRGAHGASEGPPGGQTGTCTASFPISSLYPRNEMGCGMRVGHQAHTQKGPSGSELGDAGAQWINHQYQQDCGEPLADPAASPHSTLGSGGLCHLLSLRGLNSEALGPDTLDEPQPALLLPCSCSWLVPSSPCCTL